MGRRCKILSGKTADEWCEQNNITKAAYYWRMAELRRGYLKNNATEEEVEEKELPVTVPQFAEINHKR